MKVKELIEKLQEMDGDLPVFIYTDHGQISEKVFSVYQGVYDPFSDGIVNSEEELHWESCDYFKAVEIYS